MLDLSAYIKCNLFFETVVSLTILLMQIVVGEDPEEQP